MPQRCAVEVEGLVGGERTYHLRRRYGITAEEADAMLEEQGGVCAICRAAPAAHVDHDHSTGRVRALLCFNCNGGLGQFRDDPCLLQAAAFYVKHHNQRQAIEQLVGGVGRGGDGEPEAASRPGEPPVGSHRRPEPAAPPRGAPGGPVVHAGESRRERRMRERLVERPERVPARLPGPGGLLVHRLPLDHGA